METFFSEKGREDFLALEKAIKLRFRKHLEKLARMPPRRHLKFGLPYDVEDVSKQARLIYHVENEALHVIRCFATHKDYEKWYKSYK